MENQPELKSSQQTERKNKILDSAIQLFKEDGFYNVSIEQIVKAADSSTGSFYNYFGSKDELVISYRRELLNTCNDFYSRMQTEDDYKDKDSLYRLKSLTVHILELLTRLGEEFSRVFTVHRLKETDATREDKPYYDLLVGLIETGREDKSIRKDYSAESIADILDSFIVGCHIDWQINRGTYNIYQNKAYALDMLFYNISSAAEKQTPKQMYFGEIWAEAMSRTVKDFRSDIKNLEDQWLERLYGSKLY